MHEVAHFAQQALVDLPQPGDQAVLSSESTNAPRGRLSKLAPVYTLVCNHAPQAPACDYHPCLEISCFVLSGRFYPTASLSSDPCYLFLPLQAVGNSFTRLVAVSRSLSHIQIHTSCWLCLANVFLLGLEDSESNTASKSAESTSPSSTEPLSLTALPLLL